MPDQIELTVRVHSDTDGLWAEVVELPGCFASGDNMDELHEALQEAISLYLDRPGSISKFGHAPEHVEEHRVLVS